MPRGSTYANNSYNRSIGRVGLPMGSAPVSSSSGGRSGGGGCSSSGFGSLSSYSSSSSSSGSSRTYVDNSYNRSLGRVGMEHGSMSVSRGSTSSGSTSSKTYVDNSYNRSLGRVGMEHGRSPVSRGSTSSGSTSTKTYVDNSYNRSLGRVGMEYGKSPVSRGSTNSGSTGSGSTSPRTYVDNDYNRSLGRVGMQHGSMSVSNGSTRSNSTYSKRTYVDNAYNRRLGRVGMELGSMSISKASKSSETKVYANNAKNRSLGRAGKPFGSIPETSKKTKSTGYLQAAHDHYMNNPDGEFYPPFEAGRPLEAHLIELLNRMELSRSSKHKPTRKPFEWYEGPVIQFNDLRINEKIGHGGFGDVHHGKLTGREVAVKKLRVQRVSQRKLAQFEGEVYVLCKLRHKNIITFYGACITTPNLCIVMEYMNGSLYDELHVKEHQFNEKEQMFIAMEIADGLMYLHSEYVAHCDVKPTNVLINLGHDFVEEHQVKITDFGLSKMRNYSENSRSSSADDLVREVGTPRYSAPEILRGEFLNTNGMMAADVYSFGLVMFEIFSGDEVFNDYNYHQLKKNVGDGNHQPDVEDLGLSDGLQDLMLSCWCREGKARPTAKHCFKSLKKMY